MTESVLAAAGLALVLSAPHMVALDRATPSRAAAVWLAALALRATLVAGVTLLALALVPASAVFGTASRVTWHLPLPALSWHPDIAGDSLAHLAVVLPTAAIAVSLGAFAAARLAGALRLRALLERRGLGAGPGNSLVVADDRIVAAVPHLGPRRILVSHAALAALDGAELEAALAHERGHIQRGHRPLRLLAAGLVCVGRVVPGTAAAARGFGLSLERDADEYAVRATGDPLALASAICKAAVSPAPPRAALGLADGPAQARLDHLLAGGRATSSPALERASTALAASLALINLAWLAAVAALVGPRPGLLLLALACGG